MIETMDQTDAFRTSPKQLALAWAVAIAVASLVNSAIYLVARVSGAIPDDVRGDAANIGIPTIITVTTLSISVAALLFGLFARFTKKPVRNFTTLAVIIFLITLRLPGGLDGVTGGMVLSLLLMHAATALVTWFALTQLARTA